MPSYARFERFFQYKRRLDAVAALRGLKEVGFTHKELSNRLGISIPLISNYVKGRIVPGPEKAKRIIRLAISDDIVARILRSERFTPYSPNIATIIAWHIVFRHCLGKVVQLVITADRDALVIASKIAEIINVKVYLNGQGLKVRKRINALLVGTWIDRGWTPSIPESRVRIVKMVFLRGSSDVKDSDNNNLVIIYRGTSIEKVKPERRASLLLRRRKRVLVL